MLRNAIQAIETHEGYEGIPTPAERRRILRVRSYFPALIEAEGANGKATVTDLGIEGLRLRNAPNTFETGQVVLIHCSTSIPGHDFGPVRCQVLWSRNEGREIQLGCRYADTKENMLRSWVRYVLQELGFDESCTYQKRRLTGQHAIPARVHQEGQAVMPDAKVISLGISGALLESRHELPRSSLVDLELSLWRILPTLAVPAQVLETREDPATRTFLHSMQFGTLQVPQIRLLGNYVINQINQTNT